MDFRIPAWASFSIVPLAVLLFVAIILSILVHDFIGFAAIFFGVFIAIAQTTVYLGYLKIASKVNNTLLRVMTYVNLIFLFINLIWYVISAVISLWYDTMVLFSVSFILNAFLVFISGVIAIIWGIAILQIRDYFGNLLTAIGILYIVGGVFNLTIILAIFSYLILLVITVLNGLLFLKAHKQFTAVNPQQIQDTSTQNPATL